MKKGFCRTLTAVLIALMLVGILSGCGETQGDSGLSGNRWYSYAELPVLQVQNMVISQATPISRGRAIAVTGRFFCAHCLTIDQETHMMAPEIGYDATRSFRCDKCGKSTIARLRIADE